MTTHGDEIRRAFRERRAVLFCGAGISIEPPATLPDWKTLRDETIKAVAGSDETLVATLPALLADQADGGIGHALAPELVATIVRSIVADYFQSLRVLDHDQPNRNHILIARLAKTGLLRYILSTNFDQLIETACRDEGVDLRILRSDDDFAAFTKEDADAGPPVLFKLHGCISSPDTIVATVEQEAVGLSPQKAAVLESLWNALTGLFWGYSGADLKLDVDYLKLLTTAATAKGFYWNLYASGDYREAPNEFVQQLVAAFDGRGVVSHETIVETLGALLDAVPSFSEASGDAAALKRQRSDALIASLGAWARQSVRPEHAYEIIGRLHSSAGDTQNALNCYQRLADYAIEHQLFAVEGSAYASAAELLARAGAWERLQRVLDHADDRARTAGALDLDLRCARIRAQAVAGGGRAISSIQPRAFARRLAPWAPTATLDAWAVDLDTADELAAQRLIEPALTLCQAVEAEARRAGRLVQVAEALARRSRIHELQNNAADAIACVREASQLATVLGMRAESRLLQFRMHLLDLAAGGTPDAEDLNRAIGDLAPAADKTGNHRIAAETILALLESAEVDVDEGLTLTERVARYVTDEGGRYLAVRLAVQQSRFLSAAGRVDAERQAIIEVLPELWRLSNEAAAHDLLTRLAAIDEAAGQGAERILQIVERAVCIARRTFGFAPESEQALGRLRIKAGRIPAIPSVASFLQTWQTHLPDLPQLLARLAPAAGAPNVDELARTLEERVGAEMAAAWLVWTTAVLCRQFREGGEPEAALMVAAGTLPMPLIVGDRQMSAILHNECGLNLLILKQPDRALEQFTSAIADATAAGDLAELVDDHVNAADACEAMGQLDDAVQYLTRGRQYVEMRQDYETAAAVALRSGELLKTLKRDQEALREFQSAEYVARTLGRPKQIEQVVIRLGKLYWNAGEFEASIRYRDELITTYETRGQLAAAASFALLVANTYDEKLDRPADAATYYRRALSLNQQAAQLDAADLQHRLERCESKAGHASTGFWDLLLADEASPGAAEQTAARVAMAIDYNLWRFEPRSFGAWYERAFTGTVEYPATGDPELPIWPFAAIYQLVALARSSRELHRHEESLRHARSADQIAQRFGIAQGRYLAAHASALAYAELGRAELQAEQRTRAQAIKEEFASAAAARGRRAQEFGTKIVEPWNYIGLLLALKAPEVPDLSARHTVVKGRLIEEFFMNPAVRPQPT